MSINKSVQENGPSQKAENTQGLYTVYTAGGIFTQHDLTTNVFIKDAVWRLSKGKYQLILPQSKELRELDRPDLAAYVRNVDLLQVVKTDIFIARFDGLELDAGMVTEFIMAKYLGKPTVILRCDSRRLGGSNLDEPYNLMVKSWPRTTEVHIDSLMRYVSIFAEEHEKLDESVSVQSTIKAELNTVQKGVTEIAQALITGLDSVFGMKSPYPPEYRELVYKATRYTPGGGFEDLLTEHELEDIIHRLRKNGTL